ncbi:MAG: type I restriction endonuclease subunit R [Ignavibacteriales bacterium]|nr:MAG: type I restriction endonuclease subunit R [Ignavibacteriales bacterium]
MKPITENIIEHSAIEILQELGWGYVPGKDISPEGLFCERESFSEIVLVNRLREAVARINPDIPVNAQEAAVQKVLRISSPDLLHNNEEFHRMLVEKVKIPYQQNGYERSYEVALIDFRNPGANQFLAVNQYTIMENNQHKRPDILLFVNGLPLVVIELKNAADENADIQSAFQQIQTYKSAIPGLFIYNAVCVISDGLECRAGSVSADMSRYMTWKTVDGVKEASRFKPQIETLFKGMLKPATLLDLVRNFIVFEKSKREDSATGLIQIQTQKKLAAYHQYYAVNKAVISTIGASGERGDKRGGVVWHTQGSGKSLSMVFYSGKLITSPEMRNPTIVVITDRNDLDDQLFDTFAASVQLLRQEPVQAESRDHLKELLKVASGGIVFTTIQKFLPDDSSRLRFPQLSDRRNIVVIADEAHRTQYGFEAKLINTKDSQSKEVIGKQIAYGFAKYMRDALPEATYIGFTGTPIEGTDVNTPQVFGSYIDRYDIKDAVDDGATVRIFYESRLAKVNLDDEGKRLIEEFDKELEQDEEVTNRQRAKAKWTKLEAIVGHSERVKNLARDIVTHFEKRQQVFDGKGMIVAMSRRIAVDIYNEIIALRPGWHHDDLNRGVIKVVMTASSSDGPEIAKHHTTKQQRRDLSERMKDPADEMKLVIVRDMWLTGFDAPCLNTMYIDKPMRGHNLMQAIARVNRVFKDKPGGLIVDYLGIAIDLKKALSFYGEAGGKGDPAENIQRAYEVFREKIEVIRQMFNESSATKEDILVEEPEAYYPASAGFNYRRFFDAEPQEKLSIVLQAEEHILGLKDGKERFIREVTMMSLSLSLCITREEVQPFLAEAAFFQAVKARLAKFDAPAAGGKSSLQIETAIRQIVDEALSSDTVVDIFDAAGIDKPDISGLEILSDEFLEEVVGMQHKNLAIELLKKILNDELKIRSKTNLVKSKKLLEMLETAIKKYQNNLLTTAEIIEELIRIAKQIKEDDKEGERLGLNTDEVAFYNALEVNDSAVQVLGDETLKIIAREIADKVRANATIDWTIRESARAKLMVLVRRTLTKYGYPPDKQKQAIETVLKQAELLADSIAA